jgi:hypothetical protein
MKNQNYNNEIHQNLITLTKLERKTLSEILELLRLNFNQKVFAKMGYSHLVKYMVSELGYSESAAWRRLTSVKSAQWAVLTLSKRGVKRSCSFFLRMKWLK